MTNNARLRIAYFSPLPPARSGISDYSHELLPYLAQHVDLTLFVDDPAQVAADLQVQFPVKPIAAYPAQRWQFDLPLYQMGNSMHHDTLYEMCLRFPGVVVLHDHVLHHFLAHRAGGGPGYTRELGYAQGMAGVNLAWEIRGGKRPSPLFDLPLNDRLLDLSLGTIVHSAYVADRIRQQNPQRHVQVIPALIERHPGHSRRAELNWPDDAVIFASVGEVTRSKQVDFALRALQQVRQTVPQARYLIVGAPAPDIDLPALTAALGDAVHITGYVNSLAAFVDWIHTADVIVNLRHPTAGETSATALRALAAGKPVIAFNQGWYAELPDDASVKLPPLDEAALVRAMQTLAAAPAQRQAIGAAGVAYVEENCHPAQIAATYGRFLHHIINHYV